MNAFVLTAFDPQKADTLGDYFADHLSQSVTVHCLRELAFYLGDEVSGDATTDALTRAFADDGVHPDDTDAASEWLDRHYGHVDKWLAQLGRDVEREKRRKLRDAAVLTVIRFIVKVMA